MIYNDNEKQYGQDFDQVSIHQSREVERGFDFVIQRPYKNPSIFNEELSLSIPTQVKILFFKLQKNDLNKINENISNENEAKMVYKTLRARFEKDRIDWGHKIDEAKGSKNGDLKAALRQKVKACFLVNILDNFFLNYATVGFHPTWTYSSQDIQEQDSTEALKQMFKHWDPKGHVINLLKAVIETLEHGATEFDNSGHNDAIFYTNIQLAKSIWEAYQSSYRFELGQGSPNFRTFLKLDWRNMSSGEKALLNLYSRIYSALDSDTFLKNAQTTYLLIDEGEVGLHPQWQKNFLKYLLEFLNTAFKHRVQLILTTHSPFVLSDLPNSNIIFLQKDTRKNNTFVDGLEDKKNTFGGNILTLLADSFFVQGGLIGEFAKDKINHIINLLRTKSYQDITKQEKEEIVAITDMIGEPVVKSKIRSMIEEKLGINLMTIDERIRILEEEINNLKNRKE